jgi:plastocyanin
MPRLPLLLALVLVASAFALASGATPRVGSVVGKVSEQIGRAKPRLVGQAVVYLVGVKSSRGKSGSHRTIQQKDIKFTPPFTVIMKGDTIDFPNNETNAIDHNVFSPRDSGTTWFNLGRFGRGVSKPWTFSRAGVYDIFCDIHPDMHAQVMVLDNEYYAYTDEAGNFRIPDVPEGTYEIRAWRPYSLEPVGRVTVRAGAAAPAVELVFKSAASSAYKRHKRLDGSSYPEYGGR